MKIKTILFDLGNVIVKVHPEVLEDGIKSCGKFKQGEIIDYFMDSENANKYMEGKLTSSQFFSRTKKLFKLDIKFDEFYKLWNNVLRPYPEMEQIIRNIKERYPNIKLILLSNTNEVHYEHVREHYKILDILDAYVVSHEEGVQKPHPEIFTRALKLADSLPKETFYTDDRMDLIESARVMGIRAFQFTGHNAFRKKLVEYGLNV